MLVLTRKLSQSITIGDPASAEQVIEISIMEVKGDQVRLGITAPCGVAVDRKEIWLLKQEGKANEHKAKEREAQDRYLQEAHDCYRQEWGKRL